MRRVLAALALAAVVGVPVAASAKPAPRYTATPEFNSDETAPIYIAVLRDLLPKDQVERDPRIRSVLVTDGAVEGAGTPTDHADPERSFPRRVKARIRNAFVGELPVRFVEDFYERLSPPARPNEARIWVTLGPIRGTEKRVEVGIEVNAAVPLGGEWKTDVVERLDRIWAVTGTTGRVVVS